MMKSVPSMPELLWTSAELEPAAFRVFLDSRGFCRLSLPIDVDSIKVSLGFCNIF